jgi:primosomal protein N' (replication factor Y) (superfamily II helicase)
VQKNSASQNKISTSKAETSIPQFAEVALSLHVTQTFTYQLPPSMREAAQLGARVLVPVGRKLTTGYIVGLREKLTEESGLHELEIKDVEELVDSVPLVTPEVLRLTRWVAEYYASPLGEVLRAALPPGISAKIEQFLSLTSKGVEELAKNQATHASTKRLRLLALVSDRAEIGLTVAGDLLGHAQAANAARELEGAGLIRITQRSGGVPVKAKVQRAVRLVPTARLELTADGGRRLTQAQQRVIQTLKAGDDPLPLKAVLQNAAVSDSAIKTLAKKGVIELIDQSVRRDPLAEAHVPSRQAHKLTPAQEAVLSEIESPLARRAYATFLLHGVTGSGKTEVYLRAMRTALKLGRAAMMLVPEIALTPLFSRRLRAQFGDQVAIFHSSLSKGERFDEWNRVRNGEARIVIGTRSAVFAPINNLGLVIVDEEHESTYRQQDSPYYHGRDTAIVRARNESAVVVLGSATPSLESFHNARTGKYRYLHLPERIANRPLASAGIIDMREVFARYSKPRVFSDELLAAIEDTQSRKEQSIIMLNRRGYSSFVLCRSCGESIQCPNCDVTLTYHRSERVIVCHYCNHREPAPAQCPNCSGKYIYYIGEGTEQIEELLSKLFPALRIARIDRDTTSRRAVFEKSLIDFSEGKLDMLVGTQMLAKGHDFPNVTLVGVVSVDAGLALPDFRAAERTFQLITQVAGRAGRGDRPGQVLVQTYHPHHYALRHACAQDYAGFYDEEIRHRRNHAYPPFVALASLLVHGPDLARARNTALELRKELDQANQDRACRVLGPAPAPLARLKGQHRIQLLVKSRSRRRLRQLLDTAVAAVTGRGHNTRTINVEIDPMSIM